MDRQISVQYDLLKIQVGIDINDSIVIVDSLEGVFEGAGIEKTLLQPFDKDKNIDYQLMKTREEISKQQITLEKSALIPSINAFYTHTQSGQSDEFTFFEKSQKWFPSNVIGAALVIPITTSGGTISKIKQKELELRKVQNNKALLEQNLQLQVNTTRNKLAKAYDTYLTQKKNVVLAERIYKRSLVKFAQGVITSTELTQVNTQYFNSQSAYFAAMLEVLNAKAELDKILGNNL
jgi:outer membrane protein TolC